MSNYQSAADLAAETIGHLENKFGGPLNEAKARLDELEQKMARGVGGGGSTIRTPPAGRAIRGPADRSEKLL